MDIVAELKKLRDRIGALHDVDYYTSQLIWRGVRADVLRINSIITASKYIPSSIMDDIAIPCTSFEEWYLSMHYGGMDTVSAIWRLLDVYAHESYKLYQVPNISGFVKQLHWAHCTGIDAVSDIYHRTEPQFSLFHNPNFSEGDRCVFDESRDQAMSLFDIQNNGLMMTSVLHTNYDGMCEVHDTIKSLIENKKLECDL